MRVTDSFSVIKQNIYNLFDFVLWAQDEIKRMKQIIDNYEINNKKLKGMIEDLDAQLIKELEEKHSKELFFLADHIDPEINRGNFTKSPKVIISSRLDKARRSIITRIFYCESWTNISLSMIDKDEQIDDSVLIEYATKAFEHQLKARKNYGCN